MHKSWVFYRSFVEICFRFDLNWKPIKIERRKPKKKTKNNLEMSSRKWNCLFDNQMHSIIELYIYVITLDFSSPITCVPAFWMFFSLIFSFLWFSNKSTPNTKSYLARSHHLNRKFEKKKCNVIYGGVAFVTECCIKIANNHLCQFSYRIHWLS